MIINHIPCTERFAFALMATPRSNAEAVVLEDIRAAWDLFPQDYGGIAALAKAVRLAYEAGLVDWIEYQAAADWLM